MRNLTMTELAKGAVLTSVMLASLTACGPSRDKNLCIDMIPDGLKIFEGCTLKETGFTSDTNYSFWITDGNWTQEQYEAYMDETINMGFDDVLYRADDGFRAYKHEDDADYECLISFDYNFEGDERTTIYVRCSKEDIGPSEEEKLKQMISNIYEED